MSDIPLIEIPRTRLIALQWIDLERLAKEETEFRKNWKKEKKCECVLSLEEHQLPWCEHVRNEFRKTHQKKENKIWERSTNIALSSLPNNKTVY